MAMSVVPFRFEDETIFPQLLEQLAYFSVLPWSQGRTRSVQERHEQILGLLLDLEHRMTEERGPRVPSLSILAARSCWELGASQQPKHQVRRTLRGTLLAPFVSPQHVRPSGCHFRRNQDPARTCDSGTRRVSKTRPFSWQGSEVSWKCSMLSSNQSINSLLPSGVPKKNRCSEHPGDKHTLRNEGRSSRWG